MSYEGDARLWYKISRFFRSFKVFGPTRSTSEDINLWSIVSKYAYIFK